MRQSTYLDILYTLPLTSIKNWKLWWILLMKAPLNEIVIQLYQVADEGTLHMLQVIQGPLPDLQQRSESKCQGGDQLYQVADESRLWQHNDTIIWGHFYSDCKTRPVVKALRWLVACVVETYLHQQCDTAGWWPDTKTQIHCKGPWMTCCMQNTLIW